MIKVNCLFAQKLVYHLISDVVSTLNDATKKIIQKPNKCDLFDSLSL